MNCFLCGVRKFDTVYKNQKYQIASCPVDNLYFKIALQKLSTLYDKDYFANYPYSNYLNLNKIYFKKKLNLLKRLKRPKQPNNLKILDIGCGWGDFLEVLQKEKIPYLGIDESQKSIEICRKKALNCIQSTIQQLAISHRESFSAITLFQTIEHLKNPLPLLQSTYKLLKPNGVLLITTPNNDSPLRKIYKANWSVYNTDSHFVFYNKRNLRQTLEKAGFKNISIKTDPIRFFSLKYILNRLWQHKHNPDYFCVTCYMLRVSCYIPIPTDPLGDLEAVAVK